MTQERMNRMLRVLKDPRMGYQPMIIHQTYCSRRSGRIDEIPVVYGTGGIIHPGPAAMRELLPEECRREEFILVYSVADMTPGRDLDATRFRAADIIDPNNNTYWRVVRVKEWGEFPNCFCEALAVRTDEDPWEKRKDHMKK